MGNWAALLLKHSQNSGQPWWFRHNLMTSKTLQDKTSQNIPYQFKICFHKYFYNHKISFSQSIKKKWLWDSFHLVRNICRLDDISMAKDVTPLLMHWNYVFLTLTHWYVVFNFTQNPSDSVPRNISLTVSRITPSCPWVIEYKASLEQVFNDLVAYL